VAYSPKPHFPASTPAWSANLSATCEAAENDCLERRNSIRPCVPSHVAYKAERGGNELFWSPWTMYPRSQERRRNREATVYLPALGGDGPRLDRTIRIYKCSQASSAEESLKCCVALLAVSTRLKGSLSWVINTAGVESRSNRSRHFSGTG